MITLLLMVGNKWCINRSLWREGICLEWLCSTGVNMCLTLYQLSVFASYLITNLADFKGVVWELKKKNPVQARSAVKKQENKTVLNSKATKASAVLAQHQSFSVHYRSPHQWRHAHCDHAANHWHQWSFLACTARDHRGQWLAAVPVCTEVC